MTTRQTFIYNLYTMLVLAFLAGVHVMLLIQKITGWSVISVVINLGLVSFYAANFLPKRCDHVDR